MLDFLNFHNSEQYLYNPKIFWHNVKTSYKLIGIISNILILFYISNKYIFLYIIFSILVLSCSVRCLLLRLVLKIFQRSSYYLFMLIFFLFFINNSKYFVTSIQLIHFWLVLNYDFCKHFFKCFFYLPKFQQLNQFSEKIIVYFYLYFSKVIIKVYLIFFYYSMLNKLFIITSTYEDILYIYIYIPYFLFYKITKYYLNTLLVTIMLSYNYINILKNQINNQLISLYLKKVGINNTIISKIFILLLQDIIRHCAINAFVIFYRKAYPPMRNIWLNY